MVIVFERRQARFVCVVLVANLCLDRICTVLLMWRRNFSYVVTRHGLTRLMSDSKIAVPNYHEALLCTLHRRLLVVHGGHIELPIMIRGGSTWMGNTQPVTVRTAKPHLGSALSYLGVSCASGDRHYPISPGRIVVADDVRLGPRLRNSRPLDWYLTDPNLSGSNLHVQWYQK